jgi:hypothetical protein
MGKKGKKLAKRGENMGKSNSAASLYNIIRNARRIRC